jgi:DNA replication protein DnaC
MSTIDIETIKEDLKALRLKDMANALDDVLQNTQNLQQGHLYFLSELAKIQIEASQKRSYDRKVQKANFPPNMSFDNFDWNFQPSLNVEQLKDLKTLSFIRSRHPLLIFGKTGCGKSHIAAALGLEACKAGLKVQFFKLQELMSFLYASLADDTTDEVISKIARLDLLIIDHVGYIRSKNEYPSLLLDLICACQDSTSIITTSSISLEEWGLL